MGGEVRRRTAADQQGQPSVRVSPPASQGEGATVKANRMAANSAGASRQQTAHGFATSFKFEDTKAASATAGGVGTSHVFDLPDNDRGLWLCEISAQIAYDAHADTDPSRAQWTVVVQDESGPLVSDGGWLTIPAGEADGVNGFYSVMVTTGAFTVSIGPGWDGGAPPNSHRAAVVRCFRLGDLPPGVT